MSKVKIRSVLKHKTDRSDASHAILDENSRRQKADKIRLITTNHIDFSGAKVLDIGTGSGHIAEELAKHASEVTSVDVTDERRTKEGYKFVQVKDERLPFPDASFDVVVSNHIAEHVPDQATHLSEMMRVLKPKGVIYLATPNKLWLRDPHYKLAFVSWLPRRMSDVYVKIFHGAEAKWDIYPLSPFSIKKQLKDCSINNILPTLIKQAGDKELGRWKVTKVLKYAPAQVLELSQYFSPTLIYIIKQNEKA